MWTKVSTDNIHWGSFKNIALIMTHSFRKLPFTKSMDRLVGCVKTCRIHRVPIVYLCVCVVVAHIPFPSFPFLLCKKVHGFLGKFGRCCSLSLSRLRNRKRVHAQKFWGIFFYFLYWKAQTVETTFKHTNTTKPIQPHLAHTQIVIYIILFWLCFWND